LKERLLRGVDRLRFWPRRVMAARSGRQMVLERAGDRSFVVLPGVFNPNLFRSGRCLAEFISALPLPGPPEERPTALDLGTGSGMQAVFLAERGFFVTALDIDPQAVRCARINAILNAMEERIDVLNSDLFAEIPGKTFDLIVFNPPFFKGEPKTALEIAWRSSDVVERFAGGLAHALKPSGKALIAWSSHAEEQSLLEPLRRAAFRTEVVMRKRMSSETLIVYEAHR
jgi:HemK-related putative methylase